MSTRYPLGWSHQHSVEFLKQTLRADRNLRRDPWFVLTQEEKDDIKLLYLKFDATPSQLSRMYNLTEDEVKEVLAA